MSYNLEIISNPTDKRLYEKAKRVKDPHSPKTFGIVQEMKKILRKYGGLGFAANQLGVNRRILVAYHEGLDEVIEFINPRIIQSTLDHNDMYWHPEGCFSHPGITAEVYRYRTIQLICHQLKFPQEVRLNLSGMIARVVQHEIDHLDAKLMTDLGLYVRNIILDDQGQRRLQEVNVQAAIEGQKDFVVD